MKSCFSCKNCLCIFKQQYLLAISSGVPYRDTLVAFSRIPTRIRRFKDKCKFHQKKQGVYQCN